jgi:hypothetical protein
MSEGRLEKIVTKTYKPKDSDSLPGKAKVVFSLSSFSRDEDGSVILTPELMTSEEIDTYVDLLIKDLEGLRVTAKEELEDR